MLISVGSWPNLEKSKYMLENRKVGEDYHNFDQIDLASFIFRSAATFKVGGIRFTIGDEIS